MKKFFGAIKNIFSIDVLRKKLLYTIIFAIIYRCGSFILLPGLDTEKVLLFLEQKTQRSMWDRLLGTSLDSLSLFSLGIYPYISASILIQLATFAIPYFQRLQQEGMAGRTKLNQMTRQVAVVMAIIQGIYQVLSIKKELILGIEVRGVYWFYIISVLLMTASSVFCIWLADRITEKGIGNGSSILIMVGIIAKLPNALIMEVRSKSDAILFLAIEATFFILIILAIIIFTQGTRKITIQYAKQMMMASYNYSGVVQYLPVKMNFTGVMPIIFANIAVGFVRFIASKLKDKSHIASWIESKLDPFHWQCNLIQAMLVFSFTFVYAAVFINPVKISNELKRNNGFIPGIKPGRPTADYIDRIISRVLFPGAVFLATIAMLPALARWGGVTEEFSIFYGGTSMLIIVSAILEMAQNIESHLSMLYYDTMIQESRTAPAL